MKMNMKNLFNHNIIILILGIISLLLLFAMYHNNKIQKEFFDNLENNLFSYDTCCSQNEIKNCESYGKTGVCNYRENNKTCMCQDSF